MMLNKEMLLLSAREKKFRGRGWDVQVGSYSIPGVELTNKVYGYSKSDDNLYMNFGSIQPISLDTPSLTALLTWENSIFGSYWTTHCNLHNITLCREDTSQIIYFPSTTSGQEIVRGESFFTSSDVGKTVRVLILE